MLVDDLVQKDKFKYMLTGRINQDCMENFFSQIRSRGGGDRFNPSSREFAYAYRSLCTNMLLTEVKSSNCISDGANLLVALGTIGQQQKRKSPDDGKDDDEGVGNPIKKTKLSSEEAGASNVDTTEMLMDDCQLPVVVSNVTAYIGGYVLMKAVSCEQCHVNLRENSRF